MFDGVYFAKIEYLHENKILGVAYLQKIRITPKSTAWKNVSQSTK